ncbi:MAG: sugar kinase [Pseudomonadota bacterium]
MTDPKPTLLCVGETMVEMIVSPDAAAAKLGFAGDTMNTAIYAARGGAKVSYASAVGQDRLSDALLSFAQSYGVGTEGIARSDSRSIGLYAIETDATGERSFQYWRDTSAARHMFGPDTAPDFSALAGADVVYFSGITLAILTPAVRAALLNHLKGLKAKGVRIAFDSNYRPALWEGPATARATIRAAWEISDIGFPSIDDEMALFDELPMAVVARLSATSMQICVLKQGAEGPRIIHPTAQRGDVADCPQATSVLDTTGAGDSFNGTFLAAYLSGATPPEAAREAHAMASRVVGTPGAIMAPDA